MYVNYIDWRVHPFRADRWVEIWRPALSRAAAFGARSCQLTRDLDDPLHFRQTSTWESKEDFERYWASDEISALREEAFNYYNKPVYPFWHTLTVDASPGEEEAPSVEDEEEAAEEAA